MLSALLLLAASAPPVPLGARGQWAAFRASAPTRCYAVAKPVRADVRGGYATLTVAPGRVVAPRFVVPRPVQRGQVIAGKVRLALHVTGSEAYPATPRDAARLVALFRSARALTVRTGRSTEIYDLAGAPTALDAAYAGCAGR